MRRYVFADESGCLTFTKGRNVSRYFILCTITTDDCSIGNELLHLRREMVWNGLSTTNSLHATQDKQAVRDLIFDLISNQDFRIDATILEKSKAFPRIRPSKERFYQYAWHYHLKNIAPQIVSRGDELLVAAASMSIKKKQGIFHACVADVAAQALHHVKHQTTFWHAACDPCLQIADYCAWAFRKKWEKNEVRPYNLISDKIVREYDLFKGGTKHFY